MFSVKMYIILKSFTCGGGDGGSDNGGGGGDDDDDGLFNIHNCYTGIIGQVS
jgi:hypothetical protein